jgi:hypothetical protein
MTARTAKHPLPPAVEAAWDALVRQVRRQTAAAEFGQRFAVSAHKMETKRCFRSLRVAIYDVLACAREEGMQAG